LKGGSNGQGVKDEGGGAGTGRKGGQGGSGAAAAQPGYGGALLGLRRTKASGARSSGREGESLGWWAGEVG
jgi:hypothetical protein